MDRTLRSIADEIRQDWHPVNYAAAPYLDAMSSMEGINANYGLDSGRSIVAYFLANAQTWRGEVARRVKKELNAILKRGDLQQLREDEASEMYADPEHRTLGSRYRL